MNALQRKPSGTFRFRRFVKKAYAIFASMHKEVTIGHTSIDISKVAGTKAKTYIKGASLLSAALLAGLSCEAAEDEATRLELLPEVEIVAERSLSYASEVRPVLTLNQEEIQDLPVQSINELLDYLPSIDVRQRGGNGVQADLSIRGGTFDQVLILLNGIDITDPQTGHHSLDLPLALQDIEKIEVLQGSIGTAGYSAFSGSINIITNQTKKKKVQAEFNAGMYNSLDAYLGGQYYIKNWSWLGSISNKQSDGYTENTDYNYSNLYLQSNYERGKTGKLSFQLSGQIKALGANAFYTPKYPDQFEKTNTLFTTLNWKKKLGAFQIQAATSYRRHYDQFELFRDTTDAPSWYTAPNYHLTDVADARLLMNYYSVIGKSTAGLSFRDEHIFSTVLGEEITDLVAIPGINNAFFDHAKNRYHLRYFAEQLFMVHKYAGTIGLSGLYSSMFGNYVDFGVNNAYSFDEKSKLFLNINSATRLPTFTDLYYQGATQISNPDLKPEHSYTAEIGGNYTHKGFNSSISGFYRYGKDVIDWIQKEPEGKWYSMNHTAIHAYGAEASISYRHGYYLKKIGLSYAYTQQSKKTGNYVSKYALDYLKHKAIISLNLGIYKGLGIDLQLNYSHRTGDYFLANGTIANYKDQYLLDANLYWQNKEVRIYVSGTNLLNQVYYDYGTVPQAGIWIKSGIQYTFNLDK